VLDIEGTTTPTSFVYDVLFPYARAHLRQYLREATGSAGLGEASRILRAEWEGEPDPARPGGVWTDDLLASFIEWLMDLDRKSPGLKLVQGSIWERGYRDGTLRGEVYADVPPALARWHAAGIPVAIYSSGSVLAQRLLFSYSTGGDLTRFIDRYFDTGVGPKRESASYARIALAMGRSAGELLFISDITAELDAAEVAGFRTLLCVRPGSNAPTGTALVIQTFDDIERVVGA
jgi:enolase-phosphatase E1